MRALLEAREWRVLRQQELLEQYRKPLICFTMNIAGPEKYNSLIRQSFSIGCRRLLSQLPRMAHWEVHPLDTGCVGFFAVDAPAGEIKALCIQLEESSALGRLFDLDVLDESGRKLEREQPRRCLLCEQDARICARNRNHGLEAIIAKTNAVLLDAVQEEQAKKIASAAVRSLLYEVCVTPKPGLVDCENNGSHRDMDLFHFLNSASVLQPYFYQCARIGMEKDIDRLPRLRFVGRQAEADMWKATDGVNTHKGAIFSLGLACAAAGSAKNWSAPTILAECATLSKGICQSDFAAVSEETAASHGETLYAKYGLTGVRGQAEAGFPVVLHTGLPVLEQGLELGIHRAGAATLLHLLRDTTDTSFIARSDPSTLEQVQKELGALLEETPYPDAETLRAWNQRFVAQNLSPGGCADLLALCFFLHFLQSF